MKPLVSSLRILLFLTALTPLLVVPFAPYPFVFGKMIFLRTIAAVVAILGAIYFLRTIRERNWQVSFQWFHNPITIAVFLFILSAAISTAIASNGYRAFFGDLERAEGFYGLIVYFVLFLAMFFFFERRQWQSYFKLGLLVGAIVTIHVFLRYLGFNFPFALGSTRQPGSFLGNPAFVASFLILLFAYVAFVYREAKGFWRYFAVAVGLAALGILWLLAVRGALLGLAAGIFVFVFGKALKGRRWMRLTAIGTTFLFLTLILLVRFTKESDFWRALPVFNRLAGFSLESASVATRLLSWGTSFDAFKEHPLLGWGPENYGIAYNKHYNPAQAVYAEEFFDRAHNKVLDVLVTQGVLGVLSYLGIFLALLYIFWKAKELKNIRLFLIAVVTAYFIQNLFIFDQINSYLPFFVILSFSAYLYKLEKPHPGSLVEVPPRYRFPLAVAALGIIFSYVYSLYAWNFVPFVQAKEKSFQPYNFSQKEIRSLHLSELLVRQSSEERGKAVRSIEETLEALEEVALREPHDLRLMIRLAEGYNELSRDNSDFFLKSRGYIKKALDISPKNQAVRGLYALILASSGESDAAIKLSRETVLLEPNAPKPHYYLGMTLALSGREPFKAEALKELDAALTSARALALAGNYVLFFESDFENLMVAYKNLGAHSNLLEAFRVAKMFFPKNVNFYRLGLIGALKQRDAAEMIRIAERIKELAPAETDNMDVIIDLARKEKWEILDNL